MDTSSDRERRPEARAVQRQRRHAALATTGRALRPVVPLLLVNAIAVLGQIAYGLSAYSPPDWAWHAKLAIALAAAVALESVSLYVNWHAHDALLMESTATAARLRRAAYGIALIVATLNYTHFSHGWKPTPAAVMFGGFSLLSPWLWGLHTRRAQRVQLLRDGKVDSAGAVFSAERFRWFPIRTLLARRWSIDHGVTDPAAAWAGYNAERTARRRDRDVVPAKVPVPAVTERSSSGDTAPPQQPSPTPDRRQKVPTGKSPRRASPDDAQAKARARGHVEEYGPIRGLNEFRRVTGINGYGRAKKLFDQLQAEQDDRPHLHALTGGAK